MRHLTIVAICGVFFLSVGCDKSGRVDSSTDDALKTSLEKMTSGMSEDQKKQFDVDCEAVRFPDEAALNDFFKQKEPPTKSSMFKPLHGMTLAEIRSKAEEIRVRKQPKDKLAPITEADVLSAVTAYVKFHKIGGNQVNLKKVTLLSALIEPSKQYFENNKDKEIGSTAACYVLIENELKTNQEQVFTSHEFVIVARDTGRNFPAQRGKLMVVNYNGDESHIKSILGAEWLAQHPRPEIPKRP